MIRTDDQYFQLIIGDDFTDIASVDKLDRRNIENLLKFPQAFGCMIIRQFCFNENERIVVIGNQEVDLFLCLCAESLPPDIFV
jgi:hypothetical protein